MLTNSVPRRAIPIGHIDAATALLCAAFQHLANTILHPAYVSPPPLFPMIAHAAFRDEFDDLTPQMPPHCSDVARLPAAVQYLHSDLQRMKHRGALFIRKLVSVDKHPPLGLVISSGATPLLTELLLDHANPQTQLEAAWVLTNVASGTAEQTQHIVDLGALPHFVMLLSSPEESLREQAIWALGNVAGDGAHYRDVVLELHPIPLIAALAVSPNLAVKRNAVWALSNLCRSKPPPAFGAVLPAVPVVASVCCDKRAQGEALTDALWALSYLSDMSDQMRDEILQRHAPALSRCIEFLSVASTPVVIVKPALRTVGNFASGTTEQTTALLDMGVVTCLGHWMSHPKPGTRKEACWTLSNILADSRGVVEVIRAGWMAQVVTLARGSEFDVKKEALWCISNAISKGGSVGIGHVMNCSGHVALMEALKLDDPQVVELALKALDGVLSQVDGHRATLEQCGLLFVVEALQQHKSPNLHEAALRFLTKHFQNDEARGR